MGEPARAVECPLVFLTHHIRVPHTGIVTMYSGLFGISSVLFMCHIFSLPQIDLRAQAL